MSQIDDKIVEIAMRHHCLGCIADGNFCPTYEDLPADQRGARDVVLAAIKAAVRETLPGRLRGPDMVDLGDYRSGYDEAIEDVQEALQ